MENIFDIIEKSNLHDQLNDLGGQYVIVGGLGLHTVTNAEKNQLGRVWWRGLLDFTGSRYSDGEGNSDRHEAKADVD